MKREVYEMLLCGLSGKWLILDWPNHEKVNIQVDVNIVEELLCLVYPKGYFESYATIYLIVEEDKHSLYGYSYTFSSKPEFQTEDLIWVAGEEAFNILNKRLSGIFDHVLKKKKAFMTGSFCESSLSQMSKAAKFLGYDETISFTPNSDDIGYTSYWRNVYNTILHEDLTAIFMFIGVSKSMPTDFGIVERMAKNLGIPVYRKEEYEEMILSKILGGDQNDTQSDNNSNGDSDESNGYTTTTMFNNGSGTLVIG